MIRAAVLALLFAAATAAGSAAAAAQVRPVPGSGDPHLQTVDYVEDQVVILELAPGYQMTLELAQDEQIENVAVGDSAAWQITPNRRGDRLFVKALQGGISTNMTVITSSRLYAIELVPLPGPSPEMAYVVRFNYPDQEPEAGATQADLTGRYRLTGDRRLRPSAIADDGVQTFIEWPKEATLPAVFSVDEKGQESLVNGMMRGEQFVIDGVSRKLVFRIDDASARAERRKPGKPR